MFILGKMAEALPAPREELNKYAPRIFTIKVKPDKIRDIIGPGGKTIRLSPLTIASYTFARPGTSSLFTVNISCNTFAAP